MEDQVEIWKAHPDIVGIEVSSFGRVRTLDKVTSSERVTRFIKGKILKQSDNGKGYLKVNIWNGGNQIVRTVHQLVAQTFISNPDNLPQVNHKDCDRTNNHVENLEWCDNSYNVQYRDKYGKKQSKPLLAINLATLEVSQFKSQHESSRVLGFNRSNISAVINGIQKTVHGFWFVNDDENAADAIKQKLHDIEKTGLKIKQGR